MKRPWFFHDRFLPAALPWMLLRLEAVSARVSDLVSAPYLQRLRRRPARRERNSTYSATVAASGGAQPYTWSIISGTLPAGLAIAPSTGIISGFPPQREPVLLRFR